MCPGKREISSHITLEPRRAETYWHLTWTRARLTNFIGWHTCTSGGNINETHTASLGSHTALTRLWPWPNIQYCPLWTTMWWLEAKFYILWQRQTSQRSHMWVEGLDKISHLMYRDFERSLYAECFVFTFAAPARHVAFQRHFTPAGRHKSNTYLGLALMERNSRASLRCEHMKYSLLNCLEATQII